MLKRKIRWSVLAVVVVLCVGSFGATMPVGAQPYARTFPETGKTVSSALLEYWVTHGGLALQGYPISEVFQETSDIDGKSYPVQYFERALLEQHSDNPAPYRIMPALLGDIIYNAKYPGGAPNQQASTVNPVKFAQTGKSLGGDFRKYWEANGGLAQFGYPISDEFAEKSPLDGKSYPVQYFERAELELHPPTQTSGNALAARLGPALQTSRTGEVMPAQVGTYQMQSKYPNGTPASQPVPVPSPVPGCVSRLTPGTWSGPLEEQMTMKGEGYNGSGVITGTSTLEILCNGSFTGTTTVTKFSAKGGKGSLTLATCSLSENPVATYTGKQEVRSDGLHFLVTGGRFTKGKISCKIPLQPNKVQDLTGRSLDPTDIKVESISQDRISGSQWIAGPVNDVILQEVYKINPNAKIDVASTGLWVLTLQK